MSAPLAQWARRRQRAEGLRASSRACIPPHHSRVGIDAPCGAARSRLKPLLQMVRDAEGYALSAVFPPTSGAAELVDGEGLPGWCTGIADAVESGNAVQTAHCALFALEEVESLVQTYIEPLAREGQRKLQSDKRRGRRTSEYSEDTPKK